MDEIVEGVGKIAMEWIEKNPGEVEGLSQALIDDLTEYLESFEKGETEHDPDR